MSITLDEAKEIIWDLLAENRRLQKENQQAKQYVRDIEEQINPIVDTTRLRPKHAAVAKAANIPYNPNTEDGGIIKMPRPERADLMAWANKMVAEAPSGSRVVVETLQEEQACILALQTQNMSGANKVLAISVEA